MAMPTRQGMIYINSLFVHPLFRNRGIARRLLKKVLMLRTPKGFVLDVKTEKRYLIAFYEKEGFRIARKEANYYLDGSSRVILIKDSQEQVSVSSILKHSLSSQHERVHSLEASCKQPST